MIPTGRIIAYRWVDAAKVPFFKLGSRLALLDLLCVSSAKRNFNMADSSKSKILEPPDPAPPDNSVPHLDSSNVDVLGIANAQPVTKANDVADSSSSSDNSEERIMELLRCNSTLSSFTSTDSNVPAQCENRTQLSGEPVQDDSQSQSISDLFRHSSSESSEASFHALHDLLSLTDNSSEPSTNVPTFDSQDTSSDTASSSSKRGRKRFPLVENCKIIRT